MRKKILALVLARKNSKRIKDKNTIILNGKPLIKWTFDLLKKKSIKNFFIDILVSTDSATIREISKKYKFISPWLRPNKLSTSHIKSETSALHAINWYEKNVQKIDGVFLFQPTSPYRSKKKIISALKIFNKKNKQIVSVCGVKTYKFKKNDINGSIYLTPIKVLKKYKNFKKKGFIRINMMNSYENIDIDTLYDLKFAKKLKNYSRFF